jgi:hypothetical protein
MYYFPLFRQPRQLPDDKADLDGELRKMKRVIEYKRQELHSLVYNYNEKRKEYEEIDRARAFIDGRFKVIEKPSDGNGSKKKVSEERMAKMLKQLPKDKLSEFIKMAEKMF